MTNADLVAKFGRQIVNRVTARKFGGDDQGSWAVFIGGRTYVTGLTKSEVPYYKRMACESLQRCPDCGEQGERQGHMTCQYPREVA